MGNTKLLCFVCAVVLLFAGCWIRAFCGMRAGEVTQSCSPFVFGCCCLLRLGRWDNPRVALFASCYHICSGTKYNRNARSYFACCVLLACLSVRWMALSVLHDRLSL